jgi:hypothetical protein
VPVVAGLLVFIPALGAAFVSAPDGVEFCEGVFPAPLESELCEHPAKPATAVNKPTPTAKLITLLLFFITTFPFTPCYFSVKS